MNLDEKRIEEVIEETTDDQSGVSDASGEVKDSESVSRSRRKERAIIFHLLYAAEGFEYQVSLGSIVDNLNRGFDQDIPLDGPAATIAQSVIDMRDTLDEAIKPYLSNWRFERVSVSAKLILRLAFWEFLTTDMAPTIVINEAIELAKCFAEDDAYRFINGVLDSFVKKHPKE